MSCEDCGDSGFRIVERNGVEGAERCSCRPKTNSAKLTPIDVFTLAEQTQLLFDSLDFGPKTERARDAIRDDIGRMCGSIEALKWLVAMTRQLHTKWPGLPGLRQILIKRYQPQDGVNLPAWSEAYPDQEEFDLLFAPPVPAYQPPALPSGATRAQIEARREAARDGLPAGHSASADPELDEMVRRATEKALPKPFSRDDERKAIEEIEQLKAEQNRRRTQSRPPDETA